MRQSIQRHANSADSLVNTGRMHTYCNTIAMLSFTGVQQQMTNPISWLGTGPNSVDILINVGYQAMPLALAHVCTSWGTSSFQSDLYRRHVPHDYVWCRAVRDNPPSPSLTPASLLIPVLEPSARPVPWMTNRDLVGWWFDEVLTRVLPEATPSDCADLFTQPEFLITAGVYHLQRTFNRVCEDEPELGACLSMIGAGALNILFSEQCPLCGCKRSHSETTRCNHCSRSKRVLDPNVENEGAVRARRARKIRGELGHRIGKSSGDQRESLARSVASVLYSMPSSNSVYLSWLKRVTDALRQAPLVAESFPPDFAEIGFRAQLKELRKQMDPNECDYAIWPQKISWVQSWREQLFKIEARRRGPGPMADTLQRASQARALLQAGHSKSSVARSLGVSLSNLSHILRRVESASPR